MSGHEPTNAELLAAATAIAQEGRRLIDATNRCLPAEMLATLDALHEHLAFAGGSLLVLAGRLGIEAEVFLNLREGRARVEAFRSSAGLEGRA